MTQNFHTFTGLELVLVSVIVFTIVGLVECQQRPSQNQGPQQFPQQQQPQQQQPQQQQPQQQQPQQQQQPPQPQQCQVFCTSEYNPVCANRNEETRSFNNRCLLRRENQCGSPPEWNFVRLGICAPILQT
ncbi:uncharacterized protein isoform X2 [Rhodnius prolixus]